MSFIESISKLLREHPKASSLIGGSLLVAALAEIKYCTSDTNEKVKTTMSCMSCEKESQNKADDPLEPPIPPKAKEKPTKECQTILTEDLQDKINAVKNNLLSDLSFSPEELAEAIFDAQTIKDEVQKAFDLLKGFNIEYTEVKQPVKIKNKGKVKTENFSVKDEYSEYYAVSVVENPNDNTSELGEIIVVKRDFISIPRSKKIPLEKKGKKVTKWKTESYTEIKEGKIEILYPDDLKGKYIVKINDTDTGNGINQNHIITLIPTLDQTQSISELPQKPLGTYLWAVKKPIKLKGKKEMTYCPPHNELFDNQVLVLEGYQYLKELIAKAKQQIAENIKSNPNGKNLEKKYNDFLQTVDDDIIFQLILTENLDIKYLDQNEWTLIEAINKIFLTLALNKGNAFDARHSSAGARGLCQIIESTYGNLDKAYGENLLSGDFIDDTLDHQKSVILTILHLLDQYIQIGRKDIDIDNINHVLMPRKNGESNCYHTIEVLAAGYNMLMARVLKIIEENKPYPNDLRDETKGYLEKLRIAQIFLETIAKIDFLTEKDFTKLQGIITEPSRQHIDSKILLKEKSKSSSKKEPKAKTAATEKDGKSGTPSFPASAKGKQTKEFSKKNQQVIKNNPGGHK